MRALRRPMVPLVLITLASLMPGASAFAQEPDAPNRRAFINGVRDTGQFLRDDFVVVEVDQRKLTVFDFRDGWYATYAPDRPKMDSLGRVEFMRNMVRKEVLGITAQEVGRPLGFEERAQVREFQQSLLANLLFVRAVVDSIDLSESRSREVHKYFARELELRNLFFTDRAEAERVRGQLLRGQMPWSVALTRYASRDSAGQPITRPRWFRFENMAPTLATQVWPLRVGSYPPVLSTPSGYHVVQLVGERRRDKVPGYDAVRSTIRSILRQEQMSHYRIKVQQEALQGLGLDLDSARVAVFASRFSAATVMRQTGLGAEIDVDTNIPEFSAEELGTVLARWKPDGSIDLRRVLHSYGELPIMGRPSLHTPENLSDFIVSVLLQPRMVEVARMRGIDRDSTYLALVAKKEEGLRVMRMVEDSVFSRVRVTSAERRAYYDDNPKQFHSYVGVRYAKFITRSEAEADSLRALLRARTGFEAVSAMVEEHRARFGVDRAIADSLFENQSGPDKRVVFEMLKPGQNALIGPDPGGLYLIHHVIEAIPSRLLPFAEVDSMIEDNLLVRRQEAALEEFVDRLKARHRIVWKPELVMRIPLFDPALDNL